MRTLRGTIQYDGTAYAGFQRQAKAPSIQGVLEEALTKVTGETSTIVGAGRTDAGVHARGQVVSFESESRLETSILRKALNARLPRDIVVASLDEEQASFNARFSAQARAYEYIVYNEATPSPFWQRYSYHVASPLDVEAMDEALQYLQGEHDFASFGRPMEYTRGGEKVHGGTTRTLISARCWSTSPFVYFYLEANAFLRHMARHIVGTVLRVGRRRLAASDIQGILAACRIAAAGPTTPPHGLYLVHVTY